MVLVLIKEKELGKIVAVTSVKQNTLNKIFGVYNTKLGNCFLKTQNYANLKKARIWFDW